MLQKFVLFTFITLLIPLIVGATWIEKHKIRVFAVLDNLENWDKIDQIFDENMYIEDPSRKRRKYDPDFPPDELIYTRYFDILLRVKSPPPSFIASNNSAPYFLVKPPDL